MVSLWKGLWNAASYAWYWSTSSWPRLLWRSMQEKQASTLVGAIHGEMRLPSCGKNSIRLPRKWFSLWDTALCVAFSRCPFKIRCFSEESEWNLILNNFWRYDEFQHIFITLQDCFICRCAGNDRAKGSSVIIFGNCRSWLWCSPAN